MQVMIRRMMKALVIGMMEAVRADTTCDFKIENSKENRKN
jgi:hypothetical protein